MHIIPRSFLAAWLALVAAGVFRGCGPLPTPTTLSACGDAVPTKLASSTPFPEGTRVITIVHTNDVQGEVVPCG